MGILSAVVVPDIFQSSTFLSKLATRQAIADELRSLLAKLSDEDRAYIGNLIGETFSRLIIINPCGNGSQLDESDELPDVDTMVWRRSFHDPK